MRKIINITIFSIAGLAALLAVLFGFGFNQDAQDQFFNTVSVKTNNPQMLTDLQNATAETLPAFVSNYQEIISTSNAELKKQKNQIDIFYTFVYKLRDIIDKETFDSFKAKFPEYAKSLFASADNKDDLINGFNKVNDFSEFQSYYSKLKTEYTIVRQNYLIKSSNIKSETNLLKQINDIASLVNSDKKQNELSGFQKSIKSFQTESMEFNITMNIFYFLFFVTVIVMLFFLLWNIFVNIKSNVSLLAGVGVLLLLVIIGYLISTSELPPVAKQLDVSTVKWINAGLFTFYCMFFGTITAIVVTLILGVIKKIR
ncbi:MAG: hypothetical protein LBU83_14045 [Bacteroidales bacterium]|jgi:NADH:ubiquinone oxidoreductase subunit 3 (subunit A)|nr:hypothetical protein [Bacteroidales bacterium]